MKKLVTLLTILLLFVVIKSAQSQNSFYQKIDYLKVDQNDVLDFLELQNEILKPVFQKRVKSGDILGWYFYEVKYPGGAKGDYNFVSIMTIDTLQVLQDKTPSGFDTNGLSNKEREEFFNISEVLYSEIWKVENEIKPGNSDAAPSRYLAMSYMNVDAGKEFDYLMLEDDYSKPIHDVRIEKDKMHRWLVTSLIMPAGTEYGYNFATANYFNNLSDIEFGFTDQLIKTAHPNTDIPELFKLIFETRDMVQHELWELVDFAE